MTKRLTEPGGVTWRHRPFPAATAQHLSPGPSPEKERGVVRGKAVKPQAVTESWSNETRGC